MNLGAIEYSDLGVFSGTTIIVNAMLGPGMAASPMPDWISFGGMAEEMG